MYSQIIVKDQRLVSVSMSVLLFGLMLIFVSLVLCALFGTIYFKVIH
jgi:hypothetical protein